MAEWWDQTTDWLGDTFKPGGYTGALMDAGYLDWSDILGAAGRGLLDYGTQERARNAWRPINAPEPVVDPGRSFDLYNASIANAVNQRAGLQKLQSDAAMRKYFQNMMTPPPVLSSSQTQVLPPAPASHPVLDRPYADPDIANVMAGVGQVDPVQQTAPASTNVTDVRALLSDGGMFQGLDPQTMQMIAMTGMQDPAAAVKMLADYKINQASAESEFYEVAIPGGESVVMPLTNVEANILKANGIAFSPHNQNPSLQKVVGADGQVRYVTNTEIAANSNAYTPFVPELHAQEPYIVNGRVEFLNQAELQTAQADPDRQVVPWSDSLLKTETLLIDGQPTPISGIDLMRLRDNELQLAALAEEAGIEYTRKRIEPFEPSLQPVSAARHAQEIELAQVPKLAPGERFKIDDETGNLTGEVEVIPGSKLFKELNKSRIKQQKTYEVFLEDSANSIERLDRIIDGFTNDAWLRKGYGQIPAILPDSTQRTILNDLKTIKNVIGFDTLQELRANAESGASGLGQLTERELDVLQNLLGELDPKDPDGIVRNLTRIKARMIGMREKLRVAFNEDYRTLGDQYLIPASGSASGNKTWNPDTQRLE
jgi:hypothetical protein